MFFSWLLWIRLLVFKVSSPMILCNLWSDFCEKQLNWESLEKPCLGPSHIVLGATFMDYRQEPELGCSHACSRFSWSWYFCADLAAWIDKGPAQGLEQHVVMMSCGQPWFPALVQPGFPHWDTEFSQGTRAPRCPSSSTATHSGAQDSIPTVPAHAAHWCLKGYESSWHCERCFVGWAIC